jgi:hypothetical protein
MQLHDLSIRPRALLLVRLDLEVSPLAHYEAYPETELIPYCGNSITDFIRGVYHTSSTPQVEDPNTSNVHFDPRPLLLRQHEKLHRIRR